MARLNQNGNVLFLILIAVALFAALSYAVTRSGNGGGNDASREKLELGVDEFLQHASAVRLATQSLITSGKCTAYTIRYWHAARVQVGNSRYYGDGSNPPCQVFSPLGGGVSFLPKPAIFKDTAGVKEVSVLNDRIPQIGSDVTGKGSDIFMALSVTREACLLANKKLGVENPSGEPPDFTDALQNYTDPDFYYTFPSQAYDGYHQQNTALGQTASRAPQVKGHAEACFSQPVAGSKVYTLYSVVLAR